MLKLTFFMYGGGMLSTVLPKKVAISIYSEISELIKTEGGDFYEVNDTSVSLTTSHILLKVKNITAVMLSTENDAHSELLKKQIRVLDKMDGHLDEGKEDWTPGDDK